MDSKNLFLELSWNLKFLSLQQYFLEKNNKCYSPNYVCAISPLFPPAIRTLGAIC